MPNTFVFDNSYIAEASEAGSLFLDYKLGLTARVSRDTDGQFAQKVGDTVYVRIQSPLTEAIDYPGSISASDITEVKMPIVLTNHIYKAANLTSKQKTLEVKDFSKQVVFPLVEAAAQKIDTITKAGLVGGIHTVTGSAGTDPSTLAHMYAGVVQLKTNKVPEGLGYQACVTPAAWSSYAQLAQFSSKDYGDQNPNNFRAGVLAGIAGIREIFETNKLGTFARGDIAGSVLTNNPVTGGYSLPVDAFTAATGTVKAGNRLTIADDTSSTTYRVQKDATIASNAATLTVYPALDSSVADGKAVTFSAAVKEDVLFARQTIATAVVPPAPLQTASQIIKRDGMAMRLSVVTDNLAEYVVVDCFVGSKAVQPEGIVCFQG